MERTRDFELDIKRDKRKYNLVRNRAWIIHEEFKRDNILVSKLIVNKDSSFYLYIGKFKDGNYFYSSYVTSGRLLDNSYRDLSIQYRIFKNYTDCLNILLARHNISINTMSLLHDALKDILTEDELVMYHLSMAK